MTDGAIVKRHLQRWLNRYRHQFPVSTEADRIADAYAAGWHDSMNPAREEELVSAEDELMLEYLEWKAKQ